MLDVIGAGNPDYKGQDWGDVWANSRECQQISEDIDRIVETNRTTEDKGSKDDSREFAMSRWVQVVAVSKRAFVAYWRTPQYTVVCLTPKMDLSIYTRTVVISNTRAGQIHAPHLHRSLQHVHLLARGK